MRIGGKASEPLTLDSALSFKQVVFSRRFSLGQPPSNMGPGKGAEDGQVRQLPFRKHNNKLKSRDLDLKAGQNVQEGEPLVSVGSLLCPSHFHIPHHTEAEDINGRRKYPGSDILRR